MPAKIKMRSSSVEDLGNIVKRMIDGVLEDDDQVTKLRQAVFEEYYFKRMEELKKEKAKIHADCISDRETKHPQINKPESKVSPESQSFETRDAQSENLETVDSVPSDNIIDDFSHADKLSVEKFAKSTLKDPPNSEGIVTETLKSSETLEIQETDAKTKSNSAIEELQDSPVMRVKRRQKYVRVSKGDDDDRLTEMCTSNIALHLANQNTTTNLTQSLNDSTNGGDDVVTEKKVSSNVEIIEWQSNKLQRKASEEYALSREIKIDFKSKGEIAFENWKKEKTNVYNRIFKEEQRRKRVEKAARSKQIEKKNAASEAYSYWRRQQDARKNLRNTRKKILVEMETQRLNSSEKRKANSQAFRIWKRQKDVELKERRMYTMAYNEQSHPQQRAKVEKKEAGVDAAFNMWLDQLDCVLHQKYLRERRYLVRSFYCQPAYFGSAALCGR